MKIISELRRGAGAEGDDAAPLILHARKRGMKKVRRRESMRRRLEDHMWRRGREQRVRPVKSPTLKTKK